MGWWSLQRNILFGQQKCLCLPLSNLVLSIHSQKLHLGLDRLTVQSHQAHLKQHPSVLTWSWHLHCPYWGQISDLEFGNSAVCHGGKGRRSLDATLRDLGQNCIRCSAHSRVGKMVFSTFCHQTCPGFLICSHHAHFASYMRASQSTNKALESATVSESWQVSMHLSQHPWEKSWGGGKFKKYKGEKLLPSKSLWMEPDLSGTFAKWDLELCSSFL